MDLEQQTRPLAKLGKRASRADAPEEAVAEPSHAQPSAARRGKRARSTEAGQESTAGPAGVVAAAPVKHGRRMSKVEATETPLEAAQVKPAKKGKAAAAARVSQGSSKTGGKRTAAAKAPPVDPAPERQLRATPTK